MFNKLILLFALMALASCGGMTKNEEDMPLENEDGVEVVGNHEEGDDTVVLDEDIPLEDELQGGSEELPQDNSQSVAQEIAEDEALLSGNAGGEASYAEYVVKSGETLGVIAANIYGDFRKWRSIYLLNENKVGTNFLTAGTVLKYEVPAEGSVYKPSGTPYLIHRNETLGTISSKVYDGQSKHWKYIWNNNKKLIWNPNLIFAGLTIYYLPLEAKNENRDVANQ